MICSISQVVTRESVRIRQLDYRCDCRYFSYLPLQILVPDLYPIHTFFATGRMKRHETLPL